jgi:S-adenosylmethionine-dependent methyltransferase
MRFRVVSGVALVAAGLGLAGLLSGQVRLATGLLLLLALAALACAGLVLARRGPGAAGAALAAALLRVGAVAALLPIIAAAHQSRRLAVYSAGLLVAGMALVAATWWNAETGAPAPAPTPRRRRLRWVVAGASFVLAVAASLYQVSALSTPIAPDTVTYWTTLSGLFQRAPGAVAVRTPQYPFLFAIVEALGGSGRQLLAVQFAARALGVAAVTWLLSRWSLAAASVAGAALALDPVASAMSVTYLAESLFSSGLLLSLAIFVSQVERRATVRPRELLAAGVAYGLAFLVRPNGAALVVPLVAAYGVLTRSVRRALMPLVGFLLVAGAIVVLNLWRSNIPQVAPTGVYVAFPLFIQGLFDPRNGPASAEMHRHLTACDPDLDYRKVTTDTSNYYIHGRFSPCLYAALGDSQPAVFDAYQHAYTEALRAHPLRFAARTTLEALRFLSLTVAYYPAQVGSFTHADFEALCARTGEWKAWPAGPIDFGCPLPAYDPVRRDRTMPIGFATRMAYQPYLYVHQPHLVMVGFHETPVPELAGFGGVVFFLLVLAVVPPSYRPWVAGAATVTVVSAVTTAAGLAAGTRYVAVTSPFLLLMTTLFAVSVVSELLSSARGAASLARRLATRARRSPSARPADGVPATTSMLEAPSPVAAPTPVAAANFRPVMAQGLAELRAVLVEKFFYGNEAFLATDEGRLDLESHLTARLHEDRTRIVPWLGGLRPLRGARVLEIGCGTGSSTVALAEQGAEVVAIDIDPGYMEIARVRCRAYGIDAATFFVADAAALPPAIAHRQFDFVIFFASLEHMLVEERLRALAHAWEMLGPGGFLCVVDTPNRLWFFDTHTALMNFFHWLPDDLALAYSRFSTRPTVRDQPRDGDAAMRTFLRNGRGVSYHEFELALGPLAEARVKCLEAPYLEWVRAQPIGELAAREQYVRVLMALAPDVPPAFLLESLDLAIVKE